MALNETDQVMFGEGWVTHSRPGKNPMGIKNAFKYPIFNLLVPIHSQGSTARLSFGSVMSLHSENYINDLPGALLEKIKGFLKSECDYSCDEIWLQTLPRCFGYVFNPVSFWYCYQKGKLDSVLCEVNNTFNERHFYFLKNVNSQDGSSQFLPKTFHVSPFFDVSGKYSFKFLTDAHSSRAKIQLYQNEELKLDTQITLKFRPIKDVSSFFVLKKYGWLTVMVIVKIHFQALRLWIKGADFFRKPPLPKERMTYVHSKSNE